MPRSNKSELQMTLTTGVTAGKCAIRIHRRHAIAHAVLLAIRISTTTVTGDPPIMGTHGSRAWMRDGRPITTGIGPGSIPGDGPGSTTMRGATRHFTTGAGPSCPTGGGGSLDREKSVRCTRRLWLRLSAEALRGARPSPGSLWDRGRFMFPRTA